VFFSVLVVSAHTVPHSPRLLLEVAVQKLLAVQTARAPVVPHAQSSELTAEPSVLLQFNGTSAQVLLDDRQIWFAVQTAVPHLHESIFLAVLVVSMHVSGEGEHVPAESVVEHISVAAHTLDVPHLHAALGAAVLLVFKHAAGVAVHVPAFAFPLAKQVLLAAHTALVPQEHRTVLSKVLFLLTHSSGFAVQVPVESADTKHVSFAEHTLFEPHAHAAVFTAVSFVLEHTAMQPVKPDTTLSEELPGVHSAVVVPLTVPAYPAAHVMVAACTLACVSMVLLVVYPVGSVQKVA